jgi:hypothetical protein
LDERLHRSVQHTNVENKVKMSPEQCVLPAGTIRFVIMREKLRKRFVSMDELWGVHNGAMSHVI